MFKYDTAPNYLNEYFDIGISNNKNNNQIETNHETRDYRTW